MSDTKARTLTVGLGIGILLGTQCSVFATVENGTDNSSTVPLDQTVIVEPLKFDNSKYANAVPMDWAPATSEKTLLIQYSVVDEETSQVRYALAYTDSALSYVNELEFPQYFPSGELTDGDTAVFIEQPVSVVRFSPDFGLVTRESGRNALSNIFFLWREDLYFYFGITNQLTKLKDGVVWFDTTSSPNVIAYSQYDGDTKLGSIGLFSLDTKSSKNILENVPNLYTFDLSPDDTKVVYKDDGGIRGAQGDLVYYELDTGQRNVISPSFGYSYTPRWTQTGSDFVIFLEGGNPRGDTGTAVGVESLDGQTIEYVIPHSMDRITHIITSANGYSMLVKLESANGTLTSYGSGQMYKIDFPRPIPEFNSIVIAAIICAPILTSVLLASRYKGISTSK